VSPTFALALGAGGARGLAHIVALEAFDELGVRPVAIAGSSIGALIGAAYAAGMDALAVRDLALGALRDRAAVTGALLSARVRRAAGPRPRGNPFTIDGERLLERFWPATAPRRFDGLRVPLQVVATDYGARTEAVLDAGPLLPAVAGSIAIPGLVRPVRTAGRLLVDGGAVNPLPFDLLTGRAQVLVAVDVTGVRSRKPSRPPGGFDAMFGTLQIMQAAIVAAKLKSGRPDIVVRPEVSQYRVLDFLKARAILAAAEPVKDELKREIERLVERR
jgi:NTE family protein